MPFKFHASRRHHIPRAKYRVMNWPDYDRGLVWRGDIRFWIDESALEQWDQPSGELFAQLMDFLPWTALVHGPED